MQELGKIEFTFSVYTQFTLNSYFIAYIYFHTLQVLVLYGYGKPYFQQFSPSFSLLASATHLAIGRSEKPHLQSCFFSFSSTPSLQYSTVPILTFQDAPDIYCIFQVASHQLRPPTSIVSIKSNYNQTTRPRVLCLSMIICSHRWRPSSLKTYTPCTFVVRYFSSFPVFHIHFMATCFVKITNTVYNKFQPAIFKNCFLIFPFFFLRSFASAKQTI